MRKLILLFIGIALTQFSIAQELNARISVVSNRVGNNVSQNVFRTLQAALNNFINNKKWTSDNFGVNEKIDCSFLLNLESTSDINVYSASITVQAARPVFNTSYVSPIINYKDENFTFK